MSNKKTDVIESVEEKVAELVELPKTKEGTIVGRAGQWMVDLDKARADKKAAKAEAKAAKKAEKESSDKKKIPVGVKVGLGVAGAVAVIGGVAKVVMDHCAPVELDEDSCVIEDADEPVTEPAEETSAVDQAES